MVFAKYGDPPPADDLLDGAEVLVLDFSYPPEVMGAISAMAMSVVMCDHHASAIRKWSDEPMSHGNRWQLWKNTTIVFDQTKSGAMLTWEWLIGRTIDDDVKNPFFWDVADGASVDRDPPWLVRYVQDRDLWSWELSNSREVNAYIRVQPQTVEAWDAMHANLDWYRDAIAAGRSILLREKASIDHHVAQAVEREIAGHKVLVANVSERSLVSEIGEALAQGRPFSATYFDDLNRGLRVWSFRSRDGGIDVSKVAELFGGGGHPRSSGAQTPLGELMEGVR